MKMKFIDIVKKIVPNSDFIKIKSLIDYNHINGKNLRSFIFTQVLYKLTNTENILLSDCIEILQTAFLIVDDIMDDSTLRRNKPCWYLKTGIKSVYDGYYIISLIFKVLEYITLDNNLKYEIKKNFNDIIYKTCVGQCEDIMCPNISSWDDIIESINRGNYESICFKKTGYYTFYLPIKLAYILGEKKESEDLKGLCEVFGLYYQTYDDYLDYYPEKSGKIGFDIEDRKLTWIMCRIVDEGYNSKLIDYFNGKYTDEIKELATKQLGKYNEELFMLKERIENFKGDDMNWIIDILYEVSTKLIKI